LREGEDENREVQQADRISQVADNLTREPGAVGVVIGQQPEAGVQPPAVLAGLQQRDVERRQPATGGLQGIGERAALGNLLEQPPYRLAVRTVGRMVLELVELMVEFSAPGQLSGCKDEPHSSGAAPALRAGDLRGMLNRSPVEAQAHTAR